MYVLLDMLTRVDQVGAWLDSVRAHDDKRVNLQQFDHIGFASLDVTPEQFEEGRGRQLLIDRVGLLRPPPVEITGESIRFEDFRGAAHDPWNLEMLGRSAIGGTGKDITVGHIDTGIDPGHPLLQGHPAAFRTFKQNGVRVEENGTSAPFDECGHGTMTASVLCGKRPVGVAPRVSLYVAALLGQPWTDAMLTAALNWMIAKHVRVVWIGAERPEARSRILEGEMTRALSKNLLPVTAVGNSGPQTSATPGNCRDGFSAGAVCRGTPGPNMWPMSGSEVQPYDRLKPDVVAPGHDVLVATYIELPSSVEYQLTPASGTSIAGPHLAGLCALCLGRNGRLSPTELTEGIQRGSRRLGLDPGRAHHGIPWGPNVKRELRL